MVFYNNLIVRSLGPEVSTHLQSRYSKSISAPSFVTSEKQSPLVERKNIPPPLMLGAHLEKENESFKEQAKLKLILGRIGYVFKKLYLV